MNHLIIVISFLFILSSCSEYSTKLDSNLKTDTLLYDFSMIKRSVKLNYTYNHNLYKINRDQLSRDGVKIRENIDFDVEKRIYFEDEYSLYLYPSYNTFYLDTLSFNEVLLIHVYPSDNYKINFNYEYSFGKRLPKTFPNLNFIYYPVEENNEFYLDKTELLTANFKNGKTKYTYSNFKRFLYKSDGSSLKIMYVKKNIDKEDISKVIREYKNNNMIKRIPN